MKFPLGYAIAGFSALVWGGLGLWAWTAIPANFLSATCKAESCDPIAVKLAGSGEPASQAIGVGMLVRIANAPETGEEGAARAWLELARLAEANPAILDDIDDESTVFTLYELATDLGSAEAAVWLDTHVEPQKQWGGAHGNWEAAFNAFQRHPTCYITSGDADVLGDDEPRGPNMVFFTISPDWSIPQMQYSTDCALGESPAPSLAFYGPDSQVLGETVEGRVSTPEEGYILFGDNDPALLARAAGAAMATVQFTRADGSAIIDRIPLDGIAEAARDMVSLCGAPQAILAELP